ncbi:MAG: hypothetical protein ACK5MV_01255 [Aminipila sp.]
MKFNNMPNYSNPSLQNNTNSNMQAGPSSKGNAEFQALKASNNIDMGNIPSRDLGNMLSGQLVELGKMAVEEYVPNADFGSLPSRSLTNLGKQVVDKTTDTIQ